MTYKYSILMYNFNNYEIMREPEEIDPECEYIYVTDNSELHSDKWKIIYDDSLLSLSPFDKCYTVRFNLFKYCSTPVCIYLDGSCQIYKSLSKLYNAFIESKADLGLNIHPWNFDIIKEYYNWIQIRNYPEACAKKCISYLNSINYDFNYKGLYQGALRICKNTDLNNEIDTKCLNILKSLGTSNNIERLDQTIYSCILNKEYNNIKVFPISEQVIQSNYIQKCKHGFNIVDYPRQLFKYYFLFNKLITNIYNIE